MATKRQQTMAKRAREQAVKEKRARKAERKAERQAAAAAGETPPWMQEDGAVEGAEETGEAAETAEAG
jgi:hypothetical protein